MLISQSLLKENIPFLITIIYWLYPMQKRVFLYASMGLFVGLFASLFWGSFSFIDGSWRNWYSPFQYISFMLLLIIIAYRRTKDIGFSTVLGFNFGSMAGYLYEAPRFFVLQGFRGLVRVNQFSLFHISYGVLSVLVCFMLLWGRIDFKPYIMFFAAYFVLSVYFFYSVYNLKYVYAFIYGVRFPWICLFRTPVMLLSLVLVSRIRYKKLREVNVSG